MQVADSTALVAGGASGLGWATAEMLHDRGGEVVILDLPAARERVQSDGRFRSWPPTCATSSRYRRISRAASMGELRICVNSAAWRLPCGCCEGESRIR